MIGNHDGIVKRRRVAVYAQDARIGDGNRSRAKHRLRILAVERLSPPRLPAHQYGELAFLHLYAALELAISEGGEVYCASAHLDEVARSLHRSANPHVCRIRDGQPRPKVNLVRQCHGIVEYGHVARRRHGARVPVGWLVPAAACRRAADPGHGLCENGQAREGCRRKQANCQSLHFAFLSGLARASHLP